MPVSQELLQAAQWRAYYTPFQIISQLGFSTITFTIPLDNVYIVKDMYLEMIYNLKWREYS